MKLSLAPIKYRKVFKKYGGPIKLLKVQPTKIRPDQNGYEAYAYLEKNIERPTGISHKIYGNCDGTGSSVYENEAGYIAISEALECWAFLESMQTEKMKIKYGFDINPTSTGMAAFPEIITSFVKRVAMREAVERWALVEWWEGNLPSVNIDDDTNNGIVILTPWEDHKVALLWKQSAATGKYSYGFAASNTLAKAIDKAEIELYRNYYLLEDNSIDSINTEKLNHGERRLLHFSSDEGHSHFKNVVKKSQSITMLPSMPEKLVDTEIKGSWTSYTKVWRVLFKQSTKNHLDNSNPSYFLF